MKKRADNLTEIAAFALKPWYDKAKDHNQEMGLLHDQVTVSVTRPDWPVWS